MSTSALLSLGARAMFASYAAMQTTGHNIANANVQGYSRQTAEVGTSQGQFSGGGFFGHGVDVATVTRAHDAFLTREAATTSAIAAMDSTRAAQLSQLEQVFPTGANGLGYAAGQFLNAMVDLASAPQDGSAREVVLARAGELAAQFTTAGGRLDSLQHGVTEELRTSVETVNSLARRIAEANQQIAVTNGLGHDANDLLDERDRLISELSSHIQVTTVPAGDGTLGVFIAGGQRLVLSNQAQPLQLTSDPLDGSRSMIGIVESNGVRTLPTEMLVGGSMAGLLKFQNDDLADARNLLGQMAASISARVNQQQALGLDLRNPAGAGAPMFSVGAPQAMPASTNAKDPAGRYVSSVSLSVTDASQLQASDYELRADPSSAGSYMLKRLSDGLVRTIASGDSVDGMRIDVGTPAPPSSDRFLLQPVARAANTMKRVLDNARGIAAASPLSASAAAANTGTATIAAVNMVSTSANLQQRADISFTSATGDYTWELRDKTSNALLSSGAGQWAAGEPIALNGFELELNGVPASGDTFAVGATEFPASNNGNALAMAALRDEAFIGRTLDTAGQPAGGRTITDTYANTLADIGVRVQSAEAASKISTSIAASAEEQRAAKSGVNLDEEAARLIQFQQSYQAAAKVLQAAQAVFDTLLQMGAG
jgi:flagellar hook-associated protein 1